MEFLTFTPLYWLIIVVALAFVWRFSLVDAPLWKRLTSFGCRLAGIVCLILALCRPFAFTSSESLHVVFLVDVSQSVDLESSLKAADEIDAMVEELASNDTFSVFAFGSQTQQFESTEKFREWIAEWQQFGANDSLRNQSTIAESLLRTRLAFPAGKMKRVVLFSDGNNTQGDLVDSLEQLKDESVSVHFQKLESLSETEAAITAFEPSSTRAFFGEVVRMTASLSSNRTVNGKLRMVHKGVVIQEQPVEIKPDGVNRFQFDVDMSTPGDTKWTVELIADEDHFLINNQRTCSIAVRGKPRVLVLHENVREMRPFERAISKQEVVVEVRGKQGLPDSIQGLLAFDAIVLSDFPATMMTQRQMDLLKRYVKDFGGGLAMLGSDNSFGLGGYHRTPVEEVLPLVSRFEKEKEKPSLSMVLVIDKSGSMDGVPIALARQAAKAAVELLGPRDRIGVVGFDNSPRIISEMRAATDVQAISASIDSLAADGGTNMYPAMVVGKEMLENSNTKIRHMICLSDGQTQAADHDSLTQSMADSGITVSTVALGDADRQLLANIANIGRGRYYETNDPANVPQIFTKETMQASKSAIKEDFYGSVQTGDHRALAGFNKTELPFTLGYVMTQQRPTAQLLLIAESGDPLLAVSRFGLGTGLAYTSDLTDRWGGEWLAWGDFGKFWGQILRSISRNQDGEGVRVVQQFSDDRWELAIHRTNSAGEPQSKVKWELSTVDDQGATAEYQVQEVGLGRYSASIPIGQSESLTLRLRDPDSDKTRILHYDRPYPAEYSLSQQVSKELSELPAIDSTNIRSDMQRIDTRSPKSYWFYFAAMALLLCGNFIRRI